MIINGPNINLLGIREPEIYGHTSYDDLSKNIHTYCKNKGIEVVINQSNCEGKIIDYIQSCLFEKFDGIIINAGGYTHTSIAILDALKSVNLPTIEVHISDLNNREDFRKFSFISLYTSHIIKGKGVQGYLIAVDQLVNLISK